MVATHTPRGAIFCEARYVNQIILEQPTLPHVLFVHEYQGAEVLNSAVTVIVGRLLSGFSLFPLLHDGLSPNDLETLRREFLASPQQPGGRKNQRSWERSYNDGPSRCLTALGVN
jgi:hypothetical protein